MALQGVTDLCKTSPSFLPIRGDLSLDQSRGLKKEEGGRSPGRSGETRGKEGESLRVRACLVSVEEQGRPSSKRCQERWWSEAGW